MSEIAIPLRSANLGRISARAAAPHYNRSALAPRLVHIGAGGFNRSHLAVYLDDLLESGLGDGWAECGIGLLPRDSRIHAALTNQDCLYTVLVRDAEQKSARVIGSLIEHIYAPEAQESLLERMSSPECRIVSMTVTEGGYFIDDGSGAFEEKHPDIQFDLAHPETPRTFLGFLAEAARRRMASGTAPFTVMSCDNVQSNGEVARKALLWFAELRNAELRRWIERNVAFPNSMVDRITPATTDADIKYIEANYRILDGCPVVCEPFRQWVIEDAFASGRPQWELVGAQPTEDVRPYEMIKMRLLNGGHSALAYIAAVLGCAYVAQAVDDPQIRELLEAFLDEVTPTLPRAPGMDPTQYKASIVRRFANPTIRDQITRICSQGSAKIAKFIAPTARDLLAGGYRMEMLPFAVAAWFYSMRGIDEQGRATQIVDSSAALFADFVRSGCRDEATALAVRPVFGDIGMGENAFRAKVGFHLENIHRHGAREALRRALAERAVGSELSMRQAVMTSPGKIEIRQVPKPAPGDGELLVRVRRLGVCGSDIHVYHGRHPFTKYPVVQGHEFAGTVESLGAGVSGFAPGDRVVVMPQVTCGECYPCRHGMYHICDHLRVMGFQTGGAAQEYFPAPAAMALKLPGAIGLDHAAMIEPLAVAAHALGRFGDVRGRNVVVLGAGTIGNMVAQAARALGASRVMITDVSEPRLEIARKVGLDLAVNSRRESLESAWKALGPDGADVILECAGSAQAIGDAVRLARKGSMIVVVGVFGAPPEVDLALVQDRELTLAGSLMYRRNDYEAAIAMASDGAIHFDALISRRFPLEEYAAAYRTIDEAAGNIMKVIIVLD